MVQLKSPGSIRDLRFEHAHENDFSILLCRLHIISSHTHSSHKLHSLPKTNMKSKLALERLWFEIRNSYSYLILYYKSNLKVPTKKKCEYDIENNYGEFYVSNIFTVTNPLPIVSYSSAQRTVRTLET